LNINELVSSFDFENATVKTEVDIRNGRIDLLIKDLNNKGIIIENKIYAQDQWEQLKRYNEYAKLEFGESKYVLLYLTLSGTEASEQSAKNVNYNNISYSYDIINWLNKCVDIASRFPLVRESIVQYINHLKKLTHQDMDTKSREEITSLLISNPENIDAAFILANNYAHLCNHIINKIFLPQLTIICEEYNLENVSKEQDRFNTPWAGFVIKNKNWQHFKIAAEFQGKGLKNLIIGVNYIDSKNYTNDELLKKLGSKIGKSNTGWAWKDFGNFRDWDSKALKAIMNGEMAKMFKNELINLLDKTEEFEL